MSSTGRLVRIASIQQGPRTEDLESNLNDLLKSIDQAAISAAPIISSPLSFHSPPTSALRRTALNTGNGR